MKKFTISFLLALVVVGSSFAHFQMIYTPESHVSGNEVEFRLVFTHPAESGHTMVIGKDKNGSVKGFKEFYSMHKGEKTDLMKGLKKSSFKTAENKDEAYNFILDKSFGFRGAGDWVLVAVPHPYYEPAEDIYIQQITKVMINKNDMPTDWQERCAEGYPEIMPLVAPYEVMAGGVFRGVVVDSAGKPVPNAEIEFEYINYDIDMKKNEFKSRAKLKNESAVAGVILADQNGVFSFVPPREGYWGFAALEAGNQEEYDGKELSQDAVLWIEATKVK